MCYQHKYVLCVRYVWVMLIAAIIFRTDRRAPFKAPLKACFTTGNIFCTDKRFIESTGRFTFILVTLKLRRQLKSPRNFGKLKRIYQKLRPVIKN